MRTRKAQRIDCAELRMISTAAFGYIVKEARKIKNLRPREISHQPRAQGEFVSELRHCEAAQITYDFEDVLIDGVDVVKVMLHLSHHAAELRQVAAEDTILVHSTQLPMNAGRASQDVHEKIPM